MRKCINYLLGKLFIACVCLFYLPIAHAEQVPTTDTILAPGYGVLEFTAPDPGTYQLPDLGLAADGTVHTGYLCSIN